jgi:hypothetical protein
MRSLTLLLVFLSAAPVLAQPMRHAVGPTYDPATVETLRGVVRSVEVQPALYGSSYGLHLTLAVGDDTIPVHLGPAWYLDHQDEQVAVGTEVVVVGSRVVLGGFTVIVAREVEWGEVVLVLRDRDGYPAWRGWRRGPPGTR